MTKSHIYFLVISVVAITVTAADKKYARNNSWRIPEKTLFIISLLGGSVAMYATMKVIRHKTKHKRFMIGIPAIILLQVLLSLGVLYLLG